MKRQIATTALSLLLTGSALAQDPCPVKSGGGIYPGAPGTIMLQFRTEAHGSVMQSQDMLLQRLDALALAQAVEEINGTQGEERHVETVAPGLSIVLTSSGGVTIWFWRLEAGVALTYSVVLCEFEAQQLVDNIRGLDTYLAQRRGL